MASWRDCTLTDPKITVKVKTMLKLSFLLDIGDVSSASALLDAVLDRHQQEHYAALRKELYERKKNGGFGDWETYCKAKAQLEDLLL